MGGRDRCCHCLHFPVREWEEGNCSICFETLKSMDEEWQKDPADVHFQFPTCFDSFMLVISEPSWVVFQMMQEGRLNHRVEPQQYLSCAQSQGH